MNAPRRATLFTNGSNQAIRIPRDFELTGKEALIRKEGDRLIIEPAPPPRLLAPAHGPARPRGKPSTRLRKARWKPVKSWASTWSMTVLWSTT